MGKVAVITGVTGQDGAYLNGEVSLRLGDTTLIRKFNDVRDVCAAYGVLLLSNHEKRFVNICSGLGYTLNDVLNVLNKLTRRKVVVQVDQNLLRENEVRRIVGDQTSLMQVGGWKPKYRLEDTLRWMLGL